MLHVANIQRMCFDDGPGIRTTVFLQGCNLHCPWCSNPEAVPFSYEKNEHGRDYELYELVNILLRDRPFWGQDGGVTFSGGEALMQASELKPLWEILKHEGIHLTAETALFVPEKNVELSLPYIDFYYVDVKLMEENKCKNVIGGELSRFERNVRYLSDHKCDMCFRIPCSMEYTLQELPKRQIIAFLKKYHQYPVQIFAIHDLAKSKYERIGTAVPHFASVPEKEMEHFSFELKEAGCKVERIGL